MSRASAGPAVPVPPSLAADWIVWRPLRAKLVSWTDINTPNGISLAELVDLNQLIDLDEEAQRLAEIEARRKR